MHSDNPAARLLKILEDGQDKEPQQNCRDVWCFLLNVDDTNNPLLMSRLGKVMELPELIVNQIQENYPNQNSSHDHWSQTVNSAFMQQNLNAAWATFIQHIDAHTITYLSMSADLLDMKSNTQLIPEVELSSVRDNVNDLLLEIIESEIDPNFKKYLAHYLRKILTAIDEYHISGATPIVESIESTFGHMLLDKEYCTAMKEHDIGSKVVSILSALASVVTIAVGLPQLSDPFQYMLSNSK